MELKVNVNTNVFENGLVRRGWNKRIIGTTDTYVNEYEIEMPAEFNTLVLNWCPEIKTIESVGYKTNLTYNPTSFDKVFKALVDVNIFFKEKHIPKGDKPHYGSLLNDYFKMCYGGEMDFITFNVNSLVIPPFKTDEDKFFELFKKK
jgi:hypothetical protein